VADNPSEPQDAQALRALLRGIDGVERVIVDSDAAEICLLIRGDVRAGAIRTVAQPLADGYTFHIGYTPERRDQQRVRFVSLDRRLLPDQQVEYQVTLEWGGVEHSVAAAGEPGDSLELRTVAAATLGAVSAFVTQPLGLRLAGVKQVRAFDADLVVVSLYRPDTQPRNLVGAVVAANDSSRAAVNAVLSALNRLLGNYLAHH
jgi:hypothetical protein